MILDMSSNKKINSIVTELFIKQNILFVFIRQSYSKVPKDVTLNSVHYVFMKNPNKRELQQIAINHSSDTDFNDFVKIYEKCTA